MFAPPNCVRMWMQKKKDKINKGMKILNYDINCNENKNKKTGYKHRSS